MRDRSTRRILTAVAVLTLTALGALPVLCARREPAPKLGDPVVVVRTPGPPERSYDNGDRPRPDHGAPGSGRPGQTPHPAEAASPHPANATSPRPADRTPHTPPPPPTPTASDAKPVAPLPPLPAGTGDDDTPRDGHHSEGDDTGDGDDG